MTSGSYDFARPGDGLQSCPDFNPIEQTFAKLKAWLRKAAARTRDALWQSIAEAMDTFTAAECTNYFRNSGYEPE